MRGDNGQEWVGVLIFGILVFAMVGAYLFYKFDNNKFFEDENSSSVDKFNSNNPNLRINNETSQSECVLSWASWEKEGLEIMNSDFGEVISLETYAERCSGKKVDFKLYKESGNSDLLVKSFSSITVGNSAKISLTIDSSFVNGSKYYFISYLDSDMTKNVTSPELSIIGSFLPNTLRDPLLCNGYGDDRDYLYNTNVNVFTKSNGKQSFTVTLDGKTLRTNVTGEDRFFVDNSNGVLQIDYTITSVCGGVDITYKVTNPTSQTQFLPDFLFSGVNHPRKNPKYLELFRGGMLANAGDKDYLYGSYYPSSFVYSPVTMAVSDDLSEGSSIHYPFLDYKVETIPQMSWADDGSISYRYVLVYPSSSGPQKGTIPSGKNQEYVISLRFAPSHNWILTLDPYKKYFLSQYGSVQRSSKDLRPVAGVSEAYSEYVNATNPRGYVYWYTGKLLNEVGWAEEVTRIINSLSDKGYSRLMLWQTAGMYDPKACIGCNFPSQAMNWLPKLVETQAELNRIKQAGISLGFWWGRSGQVTLPDVWPPSSINDIISANYSNPTHHSYLTNQFNLARERGVNSIGLDSFTFMEPYGRYKWLEEMQGIAPSVEYIQEHGGADIFHARSANFYTDEYDDGKWQTISGPSLLSWYLNPNSEIWAYEVASPSELQSLGQSVMKARAQQLTTWGYTYVDNGVYTDVSSLDLTISECLDHKDNNGDGVIDWPKDDSCENEFDESEG